ncbi:MAG: hypothetical protein ACFFC1_06255 [Promethearchaeota archaeon]
MIIGLISCIGLAYLGVYLNRDLTGLALVIGAILGPVFITKGVQKFAEKGE